MSQKKDTGLNTNPWPKLVDHYIGSDGLASPMLHIFIGFSDDYGYDADGWTYIDNSYALRASRKKTRSFIYTTLTMSARLPIITLTAHTASYAVRGLVVNLV